MKKYYVVKNGKQSGPFTLEEIKEKGINRETYVWFEGLNNWKKAKEIKELNDLFTTPPPFNKNENKESEIPPIPEQKLNNIIEDYEIASRSDRLIGYVILNVFILIIFFALGGTEKELELEESDGFWLDLLYSGLAGGIFFGVFYPFFSGNLGHKLMGLKVVKIVDRSPVNDIFSGFWREFLKFAFSYLVIPNLWILFDKKKQNLYDKISGTIVIKNKK